MNNSILAGVDFLTLTLYITLIMIYIVGMKYQRECADKLFCRYRRFCIKRNDIVNGMALVGVWLLLVFLAVFRLVNNDGVGGADAIEYIQRFQYGWKGTEIISLKKLLTLKNGEPILYMFFSLVRKFTDNYKIMFFLYYGFVAYCYLAFSRYYFFRYRNEISFVGVMLLVMEYNYSFSAMRFGLGVAFLLLGMKLYGEKRKIGAGICFLLAIFSHLTIVMPVAALIFECYVRRSGLLRKLQCTSGMFVAFLCIETALYIAIPCIRNFLSKTKFYYAVNSGMSVRGQIIYFIIGVLTILFYDELKKIFYDNVWIIDLEIIIVAMTPIMIGINGYRMHQLFVGAKVLALGGLSVVIKNRVYNKRLADVMAYLLSFAYFIFRFARGSIFSPYRLDIFH